MLFNQDTSDFDSSIAENFVVDYVATIKYDRFPRETARCLETTNIRLTIGVGPGIVMERYADDVFWINADLCQENTIWWSALY
jgi:hypothetical protein